MAEKKSKGRKPKRTEVVHVRLDPKLKLAADLAAAKERRTLSSIIEVAVENFTKNLAIPSSLDKSTTAYDIAEFIWDPIAADSFVNMAVQFSDLMTSTEQRLWKLINLAAAKRKGAWLAFDPNLYDDDNLRNRINRFIDESIDMDYVRANWDRLKQHAESGGDLADFEK